VDPAVTHARPLKPRISTLTVEMREHGDVASRTHEHRQLPVAELDSRSGYQGGIGGIARSVEADRISAGWTD
jgi:hypothetical protein